MNTLTAAALAGVTGAALVIAPAAVANAEMNNVIKVDKSINKVKIGDGQNKVINKVGANPRKIIKSTNPATGIGQRTLYFKNKFTVMITKGYGVSAMTTKSRRTATSDGIGVGSTIGQLKNAYTVKCMKVDSMWKICETNPDIAAGETGTVFRVKDSIVKEVTIAVLLD